MRLSPFHARERELGAVFYEVAGWERPHYYRSNEPLLEEFGERITRREAEWESRWWSPVINAEHLALRERAAMIDLSAFVIFDVTGPGALDVVQLLALRQMDVAVGRAVYTPLLTPGGGFRSDLTIMRLGEHCFRVVTGAAHGCSDRKWFADHLPADGSAQLHDLTSAWCTLGLWGPRARDILAAVTSGDVSHEGLPVRSRAYDRDRLAGGPGLAHLLRRRPRLGAVRAVRAGSATVGRDRAGGRAARRGARRDRRLRHHRPAREVLSRLRLRARQRVQRRRGRHGRREREGRAVRRPRRAPAPPRRGAGHDPLHADRRRPHLRKRRPPPHDGRRADPDARRPRARRRPGLALVRDQRRRGPVARQAHPDEPTCRPSTRSVGEQLLVEYMGERYPVTVGVVGATPIFDPENTRIRR